MSKAKAATAEKTPQPDLLAVAPAASKSPARRRSRAKAAGTAVAVDDPKKRAQQAQAAGTPPTPASFLYVVMEAVRDPACDPAKMHSLLDFQERLEAREARKHWTRNFQAMQRDLPIINRDGKIEVYAKDPRTQQRNGPLQQSTPYSTYPAIMEVCKPIMDRHGFTFSSWIEPEPGGKRIMVVSQLDHVEGHSRPSRFPLPAETSGSKNNVQGWGSSQQYGMRYNAIALLNIISKYSKDRDANGHAGSFVEGAGGSLVESSEVETLTDTETDDLTRKMTACGVPLAKVLQSYGIESLGNLRRDLLATALKQCDDFAEAKKQRAAGRGGDDFPGDRGRGRW